MYSISAQMMVTPHSIAFGSVAHLWETMKTGLPRKLRYCTFSMSSASNPVSTSLCFQCLHPYFTRFINEDSNLI